MVNKENNRVSNNDLECGKLKILNNFEKLSQKDSVCCRYFG